MVLAILWHHATIVAGIRSGWCCTRRRSTPKYDGRCMQSGAFSHDGDHRGRIKMDTELSRVVDAIPGLVWTAPPDGHIDFLNQRWCEYTNLGLGESYGRGWQRVVHPEDLSGLLERWRSILASGRAGEMEARLRRFDGEYRWFLFRASPMADASGHVVKWCGTSTDIEDRKRVEEALSAPWWLQPSTREQHFRSVADNIEALGALVTPAGQVELVNRQALEYFGVTLEELRGRAIADLVHPDDVPPVRAA